MNWSDDLTSLASTELRRRVGSSRQLGRAELLEVQEGPARGSRVARLTSAGGFDIEIFPDRGMDLGAVSWNGIPLSWSSPVGPMAPGLLGGTHEAWSLGFGGGMLATCGLDQFGRAADDSGEPLPMHGRAHGLVASSVHVWADRLGGDRELGFSGLTRQSKAFGESLTLDRRITTTIGGNVLVIEDVVTNEGLRPSPHLILYHFNVGWPFVDERSTLRINGVRPGGVVEPVASPVARDFDSSASFEDWWRIPAPLDGVPERVLRHIIPPESTIQARIVSPSAGAALTVRFNSGELPELYQWNQFQAGSYVLGIEPANARAIEGRPEARRNGTLQVLEPLESRSYRLELAIDAVGD